jgi:predicted regulator of Ras-like GTPase activity (Roadblock/LC7/MglB family)
MTFLLWTWIFSLTGALLFFGAGVVFKARKFASAHAAPIATPGGPYTGPAADIETSLAERQARCTALEREVERHNSDRALLTQELDSARKLVDEHRRTASAEADGLRARLHELSKHGDDASTAALKHELALSRETARTQAEQLEELRQDKARLQNIEADLAGSKRENARLTDQVRDLRAQAYASKSPPKRRIDAPERTVAITSLGSALQSIVDSEARSDSVKNAVIADELGLLVAASGSSHEYCDALAALGAYLADVGTKTRDVLPLHEVRQVVVRDDRDMTLTVRPLAAAEPGLALVTLAIEPHLTVTHS